MSSAAIFTIGHSTHEMALFLDLLSSNTIQVVVDVRSAPYSRYVPQFNTKEIEAVLLDAAFQYIFMGDAIGGKPSAPQYLNENGTTNYQRLARSEKFQRGVDRLVKGVNEGWRIVLMCAEEEPLQCHRHQLIAHELERQRHIPVWHIRSDGARTRAGNHFRKPETQLRLF